VAGSDVTVLGTGPIGLSFIHVLKRLGARRVVAVDPVIGRSMVAMQYGADEFFGCTGQQWAADAQSRHGRPAIVIDAVGRQPDLIRSALTAVSDGGFVLGFGGAGEGDYPIPFSEMYHRNLTLASGRTREGWVSVLEKGAEYLAKHASDFDGYISHQFTVDDAPRAYDLCSRPDEERVKVAVVSTP
jgi:threonine dehydrogenase-like Zn-dependent dehydrogenase